jgi:hypothetical protein
MCNFNMNWDISSIVKILPHLLPLVTSFSGAGFAFLLNDGAKARQIVRDQVAAVNRAQLTLIMQLNQLMLIQKKIEPFRHHPGRCIAIKSLLPFRDEVLPLDVNSLSFLLETDERQLLFELLLEQQRFNVAMQALNERSRIHIDEMQPRLVAAGMREEVEYLDSQWIEVLGEPLYLELKRITDAAIEQVDLSVDSCQVLLKRFYEAMKKRFPKYKIIRDDTESVNNSSNSIPPSDS